MGIEPTIVAYTVAPQRTDGLKAERRAQRSKGFPVSLLIPHRYRYSRIGIENQDTLRIKCLLYKSIEDENKALLQLDIETTTSKILTNQKHA